MRIARRRFWVAVKKSAAAWRAVVQFLLKSPSLGVDVVRPLAPGQQRWSAREASPKIFPPRRDPKTRLGVASWGCNTVQPYYQVFVGHMYI